MTKDEKWLLEEKYKGVVTEGFEADKARLALGEPVAYLIGHQPFLGLKIYLDSHPLIPRPETEWWTERLLSDVGASARRESRSAPAREEAIFQQENTPLSSSGSPTSRLTFLDLCSGSGAIGCAALAKLPDAQVYFGEIDPAHEATIAKNIRENNLDATRAFIGIGDLFEPFGDMQFNIIAANPPYVPVNRELPASVTDYEPSRALYAGDDGLELIRQIATVLPKHLAPGGTAWIEVDSAHAAAPTPGVGAPTKSVGAACALFTDQGLSATIRNDQYDVPRLVCVAK